MFPSCILRSPREQHNVPSSTARSYVRSVLAPSSEARSPDRSFVLLVVQGNGINPEFQSFTDSVLVTTSKALVTSSDALVPKASCYY